MNEIERYYAKLYENKDDTLDEIILNEIMKLSYTFFGKTQQFITNVKAWLMKYNIQCDINEKYLLLGLQEEHRYTKITNFILLYAKYYIYLARCKKQNLNMNVFQNKLKVMYKVHKEIAFSHQEEENFNKDWNPFYYLLMTLYNSFMPNLKETTYLMNIVINKKQEVIYYVLPIPHPPSMGCQALFYVILYTCMPSFIWGKHFVIHVKF